MQSAVIVFKSKKTDLEMKYSFKIHSYFNNNHQQKKLAHVAVIIGVD
jgi:hypothetical protein